MGYTVIEVHSIDEHNTQSKFRNMYSSAVIQDDCDEVLEITENSIAGKYEEYGHYPSDKVMSVKNKEGLVLVLCAIDDKMSTSTMVYSDGKCQDKYECTSANAHFIPAIQEKYDLSLYLDEYMDNISCSVHTYDSDYTDVESAHIHTEELSSGNISVSITSEDGTKILSTRLTEDEARQLVRKIEN